MSDCLFCKIVAKEIPNYTVFENEDVLAFLDIHPCAKGHTVVIPKKHFSWLTDMDSIAYQALAEGVRLAAARVQEVIGPDAMNIGLNDGTASGQAVPHVHWHIIPRWKNDGGGSMHSIIRAGDAGAVAETARLFA